MGDMKETVGVKRCPVCNTLCFSDMDTCFNCLHVFGMEKNPLEEIACEVRDGGIEVPSSDVLKRVHDDDSKRDGASEGSRAVSSYARDRAREAVVSDHVRAVAKTASVMSTGQAVEDGQDVPQEPKRKSSGNSVWSFGSHEDGQASDAALLTEDFREDCACIGGAREDGAGWLPAEALVRLDPTKGWSKQSIEVSPERALEMTITFRLVES